MRSKKLYYKYVQNLLDNVWNKMFMTSQFLSKKEKRFTNKLGKLIF